MKKSLLFTAVFLLAAQIPAFSQISLFSSSRQNRADRTDTPTTINADAMDIDIANNKATFLGNVLVDDPEMLITCRKMTIFLEDTKKEKKPEVKKDNSAEKADKKQSAAKNNDPMGGGKTLSRIECSEDVVITRKALLANGEEQKAFAGKAVYNVKDKTISLLDNPVVIKGKSRIKGEVITLHIESERVEVVNATIHSTEIGNK